MVEVIDRPALIVVDMQNGFMHPNGTFGKLGLKVLEPDQVIVSIQKLITTFNKQNLPVIFTRLAWKADHSDCGRLLDKMPQVKIMGGFVKDTWDVEIIEDLDTGDAIVIDKTRNSAFFKTELEETLEGMGVKQLFITGVGYVLSAFLIHAYKNSTNVCVESTVRDAFTIGFHAVVVSDATATSTKEAYDASLLGMQWFGDQATVEEVKMAVEKRSR